MRQKWIELQGEIKKCIIIAGFQPVLRTSDFSSVLSVIDRSISILSVIDVSISQKTSKDIVDLNSTINQLYLTDIYRILNSKTAEYTFFSNSHGTFTFWPTTYTLTNLK